MEVVNALVQSERGFITEYDLENTIQNYTNKLEHPEDLYNIKNMLFYGLLREIYNRNIQYVLPEGPKHNYNLLDAIFYKIYIPICYHYGRVPSIHSFIIHLCGLDLNIFYDIRTGVYRANDTKPNPQTAALVAKWETACNGDLIEYVVHSNSIGGMFRLKTKGFSEEQRITVNVASAAPTLDTTQLGTLAQSDVLTLPESE